MDRPATPTRPDLPEADPALRAWFLDWLDRFAAHVRDVDYAAARKMVHPDVLAFGTHNDVVSGLEAWVQTQWDKVWPRTSGFRFLPGEAKVLADAGASMAVLVVPWTSTGYHRDGSQFDRPGRATMVFHRVPGGAPGGEWLVVHSHMSLNRGVPQESFADRPVKAR